MRKVIYSLLIAFWLMPSKWCVADTLIVNNNNQQSAILLDKYLSISAHTNPNNDAAFYYMNAGGFKPLEANASLSAKEIYWLRLDIKTSADLKNYFYSLSFNNLTYVDLYIFNKGKEIVHKRAGAFRRVSEIEKGDSRFRYQLDFNANAEYTVLLRVNHEKGYSPKFDFYLERLTYYNTMRYNGDLLNASLQGAIIILLLYIALSWLVSRYRPYIWILTFLLSFGLYSYALQPEFIDRFFPEQPRLGWILVPVFLRLGSISFYLLMIDFLELRKIAPKIYKASLLFIGLIIATFCAASVYTYHSSNFYLANLLLLIMGVSNISFLGYCFVRLWHHIDTTQRFLVYGVVVFSIGLLIILTGVISIQEQTLQFASLITQLTITVITVIFLVGLRLKLRKMEDERIMLLEENNAFQKQHSEQVELKVQERTAELKSANETLEKQRVQLVEKNTYIETLIDELNHRVKNNLQLLYGLSSLHPANITNKGTPQSLAVTEIRVRIRAMMLVNQLLTRHKGEALLLHELTNDSLLYLQQLFDPKGRVSIETEVTESCWISAKMSLPLGLILTELITNSFKHAFTDTQIAPTITVRFERKDQHIHFVYIDNGVGATTVKTASSLGVSLIHDLTRQIKGTIKLDHHNGFHYDFQFPITHGH